MYNTTKVQNIKIDLSRNLEEFVEETAAIEAPINIYVNENLIATLFATPAQKRELATGY